MSLIKRQTCGKQFVRHRTRLDQETNEMQYTYAHFIGEPTECVLNPVIDTVCQRQGLPVMARGAWRVRPAHQQQEPSRTIRRHWLSADRCRRHRALTLATTLEIDTVGRALTIVLTVLDARLLQTVMFVAAVGVYGL